MGGGIQSNVAANTLNTISLVEFSDSSEYLNPDEVTILETIKSTLSVNNPSPALGGKSAESDDEIRLNGLASFSRTKQSSYTMIM